MFDKGFRTALCLLAATLLCATARADDRPPPAKVKIDSLTFEHLGKVLGGDPGQPFALEADLDFPQTARERYPAIVVLHTIGGYRDANEGWAAGQYRKAGFATLVYESIASRGIRDAPTKGAVPLWGTLVADGFAALKFLAAHPRIDPSRIAVTGYSLGGEVTRLLAMELLRRRLVPGDLRYAAHVATYPCHVWAADPAMGGFTGAPVLEQLGEKDDCGPARKASDLLAYYKSANAVAPVTIRVYEGAYHSWTVPEFAPAKHFPFHTSPSKCPLMVLRPGFALLDPDGKVRPFDRAELVACNKASLGYTQGYNPAIRERSFAEGVAFLKEALKL